MDFFHIIRRPPLTPPYYAHIAFVLRGGETVFRYFPSQIELLRLECQV